MLVQPAPPSHRLYMHEHKRMHARTHACSPLPATCFFVLRFCGQYNQKSTLLLFGLFWRIAFTFFQIMMTARFVPDGKVKVELISGEFVWLKAVRYEPEVITLYHQTSEDAAHLIAASRGMKKMDKPERRSSMGNGAYFARTKADTERKAQSTGVYLRCQVRPGRLAAVPPGLKYRISGEKCLEAGINGCYGPAPETFGRDEWVVFDLSRKTIPTLVIEAAAEKLHYNDLPAWAKLLYDEGVAEVDNGLYSTQQPQQQQCRHGVFAPCPLCDFERGASFTTAFNGFGLSPSFGGRSSRMQGPQELFVHGYSRAKREAEGPAPEPHPHGWRP